MAKLTQPVPFREALLRVDISHVVPSTLSHAELSGIAADIRERTFTAARVANAEALQRLREQIRRVVNGEITESQARAKLLDIGLPPGRVKLIVETQTGMARGYGQWRQSQAVLKSFPALEFFRAEERQEPRDWPERWAKAGGSFFPGESDYPEGRMIALVNDPIWEQISAFGQPYPPFDFNSGMWTRRVSMAEALKLKLLKSKDDVPEAEDRDFDDDEQYDAGELDDDLKDALLDSLGDGYEWKKGVLVPIENRRLANARDFVESEHPRDQKGEFTDKGKTVKTADGKRRDKAKLAEETHKPVESTTLDLAKQSELAVAAAVAGEVNPDYEPFDVEHRQVSIEIKTFVSNKNDKITIHGAEDEDAIGAMTRKLMESQRTRKPCIIVLHDVRNGRDDWYVRAGVGSFYMDGMSKLKGIKSLDRWINKHRDEIRQFYADNIQGKKFAYRFGLTLREALDYNRTVQALAEGLTQKAYMKKVRAHARTVLKAQMARGRCNALGQAIDKKGNRL